MNDGKIPFTKAMAENFRLPNQPLTAFAAELKELSPNDKADYYRIMQESGIDCAEPVNIAPQVAKPEATSVAA